LEKAKYGSTRPVEDLDLILWGDLKTMFEPNVEDEMQHMHIYILVEKKYHLTPATITDMLNKKFQCDHFSEMAYQLLKSKTKQGRIVGIKRLLDDLGDTAAKDCVTATKQTLMMFINFNEKYVK
ncbi:hypothetical protein Tco_1224607, partial [Tanacetum coccineum]